MDWDEKQQCVLCDRGGDLLVCNDNGCPISVHKNCMGCEAHFDERGNFHCPYCLYKRLAAEACQLKAKVMLTKKALSAFLEEETIHENNQEPIVGMSNPEEEVSSKDKLVDGNDLVCDDVQNHCEETRGTFVSKQTNGHFKGVGEIHEVDDVNTCKLMVIYEPNSNPVDGNSYKDDGMKLDRLESDVRKSVKVDKQTRNDKCRSEVVDRRRHATSIEEETQSKNADKPSFIEKQYTCRKRIHSVTFNKNENRSKDDYTMEVAAEMLLSIQRGGQLQSKSNSKVNHDESDKRHKADGPSCLLDNPNAEKTKRSLEATSDVIGCTKTNNISNLEVKNSSKQLLVTDRSINLPLPNGKHRVLWSEEEKDMLKEGVQKFSVLSRKNLPWKKILEFGRHVFDSSRTPSDLKDKWRKIAK